MSFVPGILIGCLWLLLASLPAVSVLGQTGTLSLVKPANTGTAELFDEFGNITGEDRSARFDVFFNELNNSNGVGYVFIYCGKICAYGEFEAHMRGIELKRSTRGFDRERLVVMHGGFKERTSVELWQVPKDGSPPRPRGSVHLRNVIFSEKPRKGVEPYDCCDDNGYLWKMLKP